VDFRSGQRITAIAKDGLNGPFLPSTSVHNGTLGYPRAKINAGRSTHHLWPTPSAACASREGG
jgi:hypothetical protein